MCHLPEAGFVDCVGNMRDAYQRDSDDRQNHVERDYRVCVAAMHERIDDSRDDTEQVQPEVELLDARDGKARRREPHMTKIDEARNDREEQSDHDKPRGAFSPEHIAGGRIGNVEYQRTDKEAVGNGVQEIEERRGESRPVSGSNRTHGSASPGGGDANAYAHTMPEPFGMPS